MRYIKVTIGSDVEEWHRKEKHFKAVRKSLLDGSDEKLHFYRFNIL